MINPLDFTNLAFKVVNSFLKRNPHLYAIQEDIEQEAMLAVVEGARSFKDTGKVKFTTYIAIQVQNRILNYLRDYENKFSSKDIRYLEDLVTPESEDDNALSWEEMVPGSVVDVESIMTRLEPDELNFVKLSNNGMTRHQIRESLGCSWEHFEALKERTIAKLESFLV
jgi:RNA polymerase sigma factor (sigma-70 family)